MGNPNNLVRFEQVSADDREQYTKLIKDLDTNRPPQSDGSGLPNKPVDYRITQTSIRCP